MCTDSKDQILYADISTYNSLDNQTTIDIHANFLIFLNLNALNNYSSG